MKLPGAGRQYREKGSEYLLMGFCRGNPKTASETGLLEGGEPQAELKNGLPGYTGEKYPWE